MNSFVNKAEFTEQNELVNVNTTINRKTSKIGKFPEKKVKQKEDKKQY